MIDFTLDMFVIEPSSCIYDGQNRLFLDIPINVIGFNAIQATEKNRSKSYNNIASALILL